MEIKPRFAKVLCLFFAIFAWLPCYQMHFPRARVSLYGTRTADTQRRHKSKKKKNLKIWADVADKIRFCRT